MHDNGRQFACKCLNMRIREQPAAPPSPTEWPVDSNWERVYVEDKGITIVGFRYAYALIRRADGL